MSFAILLIEQINEAGYSQRAFAKVSGLSQGAVNLYCRGKRTPTDQSFRVMLAALSIQENSPLHKRLGDALAEAREDRPEPKKRSYGIKATRRLRKIGRAKLPTTSGADACVDVFFKFSGRERSEELEHHIREAYNAAANKEP